MARGYLLGLIGGQQSMAVTGSLSTLLSLRLIGGQHSVGSDWELVTLPSLRS